MGNEQEVILNIDVKYEDAFDNVVKYRMELERLKTENKSLEKEFKAGKVSQEEYSRRVVQNSLDIKECGDQTRAWSRVLKASIEDDKQKTGSLKEMRGELSGLKARYAELSQTERESARGRDLQEKIKGLNDQVKYLEADLGDFQRFVGDYQGSITRAFGQMEIDIEKARKEYDQLVKTTGVGSEEAKKAKENLDNLTETYNNSANAANDLSGEMLGFIGMGNPTAQMVAKMGSQIGSLSQGFVVLKGAISAAWKQLLVLMANPVVLALAAIVAVLAAISSGIATSETNTQRWKEAMAPFVRILNSAINQLQKFAGMILSVVEAGGMLMNWVSGMCESLPILGKYFKEHNDQVKESIALSKEQFEIEKQTRKDQVDNAKDMLAISELKKKAKDKENYTDKERLEAIKKANDMELNMSKRNMDLAERKLKALQIESEWADNNAEANNQLAQLEADVYNAKREYSEKARELLEQENTIKNEIIAKDKARADELKAQAKEAEQRTKEQRTKELEAIRQAEDAAFSLVKDSYEKQRQAVEQSYSRQIEDLKTKLTTEENLTKQAKEAINQTILSLEEAKNKELKTLSDSHLQEQLDKEVAVLQLKLEAVKNGTKEEFALRQKLLESERQAELEANRQLAEEKRMSEADINAKYDFQAQTLKDEQRSVELDKSKTALENEFAEKLLKLGDNMLAEAELKHEYERAELDRLLSLDEEEKARLYGSEEAYTAAVLAQTGRVNDAKKLLIKTQQESVQMQLEAARTIGEGFASVLDTFAEDSEALAAFSKTVALFNIGIATAEAIAKGVASAQAVGFPLNIPAIATTIAAVMSNIGRAKQLLSKEKEPKAPKFAEGGDVVGGSHANGGVLIEAEGGEAIINKNSMSNPILRSMASAINVAGGGVPFANAMPIGSIGSGGLDMSAMKEMFAEVIREMPTPVVSVVEITDKQNRVKAIENQSTL